MMTVLPFDRSYVELVDTPPAKRTPCDCASVARAYCIATRGHMQAPIIYECMRCHATITGEDYYGV